MFAATCRIQGTCWVFPQDSCNMLRALLLQESADSHAGSCPLRVRTLWACLLRPHPTLPPECLPLWHGEELSRRVDPLRGRRCINHIHQPHRNARTTSVQVNQDSACRTKHTLHIHPAKPTLSRQWHTLRTFRTVL
eukprot:2729648-Prymnesium_polylepis.1